MNVRHLIHGDVDPYVGFPVGQWTGHTNTDGSERDIFIMSMNRLLAERWPNGPELIIEVGTFLGGSAIFMAKHIRQQGWPTKILCVDTWLGGVDHWLRAREKLRPHYGRPSLYYYFLNNVLDAGLQEIIVPFPLDSGNAFRFLKENGVCCQMVYIDASHEEGDVLRDYENYWQLLDHRGVFLVDDLSNHFPGVIRDFDALVKENGLTVELIEGEKAFIVKP